MLLIVALQMGFVLLGILAQAVAESSITLKPHLLKLELLAQATVITWNMHLCHGIQVMMMEHFTSPITEHLSTEYL
jgi:hypothetical protein